MTRTTTPAQANPAKLSASPATQAELNRIHNPLERLVKAADIAALYQRRTPLMAEIRARRSLAVVALNRYHGYNKADIARRIGAVDRRTVDAAFRNVDLRDIPQAWVDSEEAALEAATDLQRTYLDNEAAAAT